MSPLVREGQGATLRAWLLFGTVIAVSCPVNAMPASNEESAVSDSTKHEESVGSDSTKHEESAGSNSTKRDCRYEGIGMASSANGGSSRLEVFPENDVFRPLLADPKQPQLFASYQGTQVQSNNTHVNLGSVGLGENFGLVGRRNGCNGWQVSIGGAVLAQFNMDAHSKDLVNADYIIGIPVSWRRGLFSTRVRLYHQSSHLGDEFLLGNPGTTREDMSFEAVEGILSLDAPGGWGRVYGGGTYLVHRAPQSLDRSGVQWGFELRGPTIAAPLLRTELPELRLTPVFGSNFTSWEESRWNVNTNVVGGLEWSKAGSDRRLRLLLNYYYGHAPYGQFYGLKIEQVGIGLYVSF